MTNWLILTNYLNSYAQIKYYEEIAGIAFIFIFFGIVGILYLIDWWKHRKG